MVEEVGATLVLVGENGRPGPGEVPEIVPVPEIVIVDAGGPRALEYLVELREELPEAVLIGHLSTPEKARWLAAERAGCDLVVNRGAVAAHLRRRLVEPASRYARFWLFDSADVAGRLGFVYRADATPVGAVSVYHLDKRLFAICDSCPHAGHSLAGGEVEGSVVTCPAHGSQFDVRTGERLRGPADEAVRSFRLLEEGGRVFLLYS